MLAQALMRAPEVLILDESASGLDPAEVRSPREHLAALAQRGAAVLVSSHQLAEVQQLATHAVVMNRRGRHGTRRRPVVTAPGMASSDLVNVLLVFGWHPFHRIGAGDLSTGDAIGRVLAAAGYTVLCMLSIAAIAFVLSLLLPRGAEALAVAIVFVVVASILNGQRALHALSIVLPVHCWQMWRACSTRTRPPTSPPESWRRSRR